MVNSEWWTCMQWNKHQLLWNDLQYQPWKLLYGYNISTCIDHRRLGLSCSWISWWEEKIQQTTPCWTSMNGRRKCYHHPHPLPKKPLDQCNKKGTNSWQSYLLLCLQSQLPTCHTMYWSNISQPNLRPPLYAYTSQLDHMQTNVPWPTLHGVQPMYAAGRYNSCISCRADWKLPVPTDASEPIKHSVNMGHLHNSFPVIPLQCNPDPTSQPLSLPNNGNTPQCSRNQCTHHPPVRQNIKPCLNQKNAQTLQRKNANKGNVQHTIKHPKR